MGVPTDRQTRFEVLVVDDDWDIRDLLVEYCRSRNLDVTSAADGRAAVAELARWPGRYALVLTDVAMPGADGFAVLEAARATNPTAYVVMVTGYSSMDIAIQAVRAGANDYLAKPFALGQIDVVLGRVRERLALAAEPSPAPPVAPAAASPDVDSINARLSSLEQAVSALVAAIGAQNGRPASA